METRALYLLVLLFCGLILFSIVAYEKNRKIHKAARALFIPEEYIPFVKYLLLELYKNNEYLFRESDKNFYLCVERDQIHLFTRIQRRIYELESSAIIYQGMYI